MERDIGELVASVQYKRVWANLPGAIKIRRERRRCVRTACSLVGRFGSLSGVLGTCRALREPMLTIPFSLQESVGRCACNSFRPRQIPAAPSGRDRLTQLLQAATDSCSSFRPRQTPAAPSGRDKLLQLFHAATNSCSSFRPRLLNVQALTRRAIRFA